MSEDVPAPDILTAHAARQPEKPAVIDDRPDGSGVRWSYRDLERRANRLANALRGAGVRAGDRVLWCGRNSPDVVAMTHAARKIGVTAVPLNYRLAPEEAAYVADNSDAVLAWLDADEVPLFERIRGSVPKLREVVVFGGEPGSDMRDGEAWLAAASEAPPEKEEGGGESLTMIYTSGTTGAPKGAVRRGTGDPQQVRALLAEIGYRPDDVYLTTGPLYHSGPGGFMALAFLLGNTVVLQRSFDPEDWLRLVERHGVTTTFAAPTPIRRVCNLPDEVKRRYDTSSLRITIANAAPWSFPLKQAYLRDFPEDSLWEVYGSTELGVNTLLAPRDQLRKPGSCGKPAPGVEVKLLDEEGNEVTEAGVPGELFVRSKSVFSTYHKAEEKYEAERRGEFHTVGDIAYRDEEGFLFICDRKKDMIISGGMNIYPAEVESALEHHSAIDEVAVFGIPSEEWGESVHAVVVLRPGAKLGEEGVVAFAREHLAGYKIPRSVAFREELPKTGSGKVLKRELRAPFWEGYVQKV